MTPPLILASTSRYRRELLNRLGLAFTVEAPGVTENHLVGEPPQSRALRLSAAKADAVADRHPDAVVIGSDQVAATATGVLDKPGTASRAREQLARLSGHSAQFLTAVSIRHQKAGISLDHIETVAVHFRTLSAAEIDRYVAKEQPLDCAGSFRSEALGITLFTAVESRDPTALVGLPLIWVADALRRAGFELP